MSEILFSISTTDSNPWLLHVEMVAANAIVFDLNIENLDFMTAVADICKVAPHMIQMDMDLAEFFDGAEEGSKTEDRMAIAKFLGKYGSRLPEDTRRMLR